MTAPEGGFYSATDADSEGEEGKFFVWTPAEIEAILGEEEARRFCAYYDITDSGNWEGKSIPNVRRSRSSRSRRSSGSAPRSSSASLDRARPKVYEARRERVPPGLDDKILTAWNGLMISAMAEGYRILGDRRYLDAAARAADFLLEHPGPGRTAGCCATYRAGKAHLDAYLEDYAYLCRGPHRPVRGGRGVALSHRGSAPGRAPAGRLRRRRERRRSSRRPRTTSP